VSRDYQESVYTYLCYVISRAFPKPKSGLTFSGNITIILTIVVMGVIMGVVFAIIAVVVVVGVVVVMVCRARMLRPGTVLLIFLYFTHA